MDDHSSNGPSTRIDRSASIDGLPLALTLILPLLRSIEDRASVQ